MSGYQDVTQPLYDFANEETLVGMLLQFQKIIARDMEDMLPATIIAYNRTSNVASVQPNIHMVSTDGTLVSRGAIASVPVLCLGAGGFMLSFPCVPGSRGWIKANDRDISLYMQTSAAAGPNTARMHSFSDGLFIPDVVSGYTIAAEDTNNMVIQNTSGTIRIALWSDRVRITSPFVQIKSPIIQFESAPVVTEILP